MIYGFTDLQQVFKTGSKLPSPARVREILNKNKIAYGQDNQGRPFTTQTAFDYALGVTKQPTTTLEQPPAPFEA